ncbi:MAG: hypothetical protein HQM08_21575 [Candidatus Riflebacteria bacterium]|nr:hypothetical protein [Candidatus Riflebacteria bacterium]
MKKFNGFTIFEILLALIVFSSAMAFLYGLFSSSSQGTLDSYNETIAYTIAEESLEWVAGLGYERLNEWCSDSSTITPDELGISVRAPGALGGGEPFQDITKVTIDGGVGKIDYPEDYQNFERRVVIQKIPSANLIYVETTVQIKLGFFKKGRIVLGKLVGAEYL